MTWLLWIGGIAVYLLIGGYLAALIGTSKKDEHRAVVLLWPLLHGIGLLAYLIGWLSVIVEQLKRRLRA